MEEYACEEFKHLSLMPWEGTEKIDGTNIRIGWNGDGNIFIGGKTDNAQLYIPLLERLRAIFTPEVMSEQFTPDNIVVLYGEGYGARIQKGGGNYIPDGVDFILFDININGIWLTRTFVDHIAERLGIRAVPHDIYPNLHSAIFAVRHGFKSRVAQADMIAEGLVLRPVCELNDRRGRRIITKVKHADKWNTSLLMNTGDVLDFFQVRDTTFITKTPFITPKDVQHG